MIWEKLFTHKFENKLINFRIPGGNDLFRKYIFPPPGQTNKNLKNSFSYITAEDTCSSQFESFNKVQRYIYAF